MSIRFSISDDGEEAVELVLHNDDNKRQLTIAIAEWVTVEIVRIDERLKRTRGAVSAQSFEHIEAAVDWLLGKEG